MISNQITKSIRYSCGIPMIKRSFPKSPRKGKLKQIAARILIKMSLDDFSDKRIRIL